MNVSAEGATLEFDCARAEITEPLAINAEGNFRVSGKFLAEHGGPIRNEEHGQGGPAVFQGSVDGDEMKLTMEVIGDTTPRKFELSYNNSGRLMKCR